MTKLDTLAELIETPKPIDREAEMIQELTALIEHGASAIRALAMGHDLESRHVSDSLNWASDALTSAKRTAST